MPAETFLLDLSTRAVSRQPLPKARRFREMDFLAFKPPLNSATVYWLGQHQQMAWELPCCLRMPLRQGASSLAAAREPALSWRMKRLASMWRATSLLTAA